ncbi:hypothetical protein MKW98_026191 [Papaver atlanticum]|uniref:Uncharacterized protein n=1 Tax=Papaver atlanticum TaxID=357466 RepID=A0AAD4TK60_9MAGN|nr:hypothetical protein MKW98_026191 [Papaver atlanticum]
MENLNATSKRTTFHLHLYPTTTTTDGSLNRNHTTFKRMICGIPDFEAYFDRKNEHVSWNSNKVIKLNPCETSRNDIRSKTVKYHLKMDRPSKFMIMCLTRIEDALLRNGTLKKKKHKSFLVSDWGIEFWQGFMSRSNILDTSGDSADVISENEKEGIDIDGLSFLYLVTSQEITAQVRSVCKPLHELGIQTVCLHTAAPQDHQIRSLKASEPEFFISTPQIFLELVSLEAIDMSRLSLLIKATKQYIPGESQAVIFNGSLGSFSSSALKNMLGDHKAICRLSANVSITSQSVGISQSVDTCTSEEKLSKVQISQGALCRKNVKLQLFVDTLTAQGYSISKNSFSDGTQDLNSNYFEVVIMISLPLSIGNYVIILTRMARRTVNGVLHSLFSLQKYANLAGPLMEILEQCGQTVLVPLRNYLYSSFLL